MTHTKPTYEARGPLLGHFPRDGGVVCLQFPRRRRFVHFDGTADGVDDPLLRSRVERGRTMSRRNDDPLCRAEWPEVTDLSTSCRAAGGLWFGST